MATDMPLVMQINYFDEDVALRCRKPEVKDGKKYC